MVPRYPAPPASAARPTVLRGSPGPRGTLGHLLRCLRAACVGALLAAASPDASAGNADVEALRQRIETLRTEGDARIGAGSAAARAMVASLYERRGFAPLWDDARRVRLLLAAIEASATHGLDPRDYHADLLVRPQAAERVAPSERDLLLTDAFMRLAYHLVFGKADPRALQNGWNFSRSLDGVDPDAALAALLAAPDPAAALEDLAPRLPTYRDLRRALAQLREIEQRGGWSPLEGGPKLEPGATGRRVVQLRARLLASGDLVASSTEAAAFDRELEAALRRFQARHGLEIDGVVGPQTLGALNVGVAERIAQVRANLERLRWVARDLAGDYLLVDIAGFAAQLWLDDMPAWSARVVVGKPFRKTPEFRATMKYLVLNPEWSVPPTILREDVLPKVVKDPGYLQRHDMRLLAAAGRTVDPQSIDWSSYRNRPREFPFQIVQSAGPDNPLGRVKFMFPNEFSVYLHDTPTRALFEKTVRAFSSGCIRIENPLALAQLLLDDPERWSEQQLLDAIAAGKAATVPVRRSVPVLLLYFTAVGGDGDVQFRRDLYNRDGPIIDALAAPFRFAPIDRGRRAAAAR